METRWRDWLKLSRPHFHSVGVLPFTLGLTISWRLGNPINWPVFLLGLLVVIFIMLAAYYGGEAYDVREDSTTWSEGGNPFSGGSGMVVKGRITPGQAKRASLAAFLADLALGAHRSPGGVFLLHAPPPMGQTGLWRITNRLLLWVATRGNGLLSPVRLNPSPSLLVLHSNWVHDI